jgi:hypothetical protein
MRRPVLPMLKLAITLYAGLAESPPARGKSEQDPGIPVVRERFRLLYVAVLPE